MQFITGADVSGELPSNLNWAALADPEATTVVYMGRRTFPTLAAKLIAHGLAPNTPALFAESSAVLTSGWSVPPLPSSPSSLRGAAPRPRRP